MKRTFTVIVVLVFSVVGAAAVSAQNSRLILEAGGLREAGPPRLVSNYILLSYKFPGDSYEGQIRTVAAAFEHESFSVIRPFSRNEHGVFVLAVERDPGLTALRYRLVVDGVWTPDPNSLATRTDRWGVNLSEFVLPPTAEPSDYPLVRGDGLVEFRVVAESGRTVALVGSFNGWDPFMTRMTESSPGVYSRIVRLPPGEHEYYFMVDGYRFADPANDTLRSTANGMPVSVVQLP